MKNLRKWSLLLIVVIFAMASCKPYHEDVFVNVEPNETAFVVPMEQGTSTNQEMFESEEFLAQNKVATKRIYTPTIWHQTGRAWFTGDWIPTVRVIKVDRTPVTREWTSEGKGTDGAKKQDIEVESQESIGFAVKVTATANIPEDWAARFRYNYNTRTLAEVMDLDVRGRIQNMLTTEFGERSLTKCQTERADVFKAMRDDVISYFKTKGVNITNIGAGGGFDYVDESIQIAINEKFSSNMKVEASENEVKSANNFAQARNTIVAQKNLDADIRFKDAMSVAMENGTFPVPNTLVIGDDMTLMDVYGATKLNK